MRNHLNPARWYTRVVRPDARGCGGKGASDVHQDLVEHEQAGSVRQPVDGLADDHDAQARRLPTRPRARRRPARVPVRYGREPVPAVDVAARQHRDDALRHGHGRRRQRAGARCPHAVLRRVRLRRLAGRPAGRARRAVGTAPARPSGHRGRGPRCHRGRSALHGDRTRRRVERAPRHRGRRRRLGDHRVREGRAARVPRQGTHDHDERPRLRRAARDPGPARLLGRHPRDADPRKRQPP
jgi:hypothetical protein